MDWIAFSPIGRNVNIVWVKSYIEFINYIKKHGLPDAICFDHDLSDYEHLEEKTGSTVRPAEVIGSIFDLSEETLRLALIRKRRWDDTGGAT